MLKTMMTVVLSLGMGFFATDAEARRGGGGSAEFLEFVATTTIPPAETGGAQVSLCHLIKKQTAMFIPYWYESKGYALAENRCDTESYYPLSAEDFTRAQSLGMIPTDTPMAPSIGLARRIPTILLGLLVAFGIMVVIQQTRRKKARLAEMGNVTPFEQRMLDVLCHAAKSDGVTDDRELATIATIAAQVTGNPITVDQARRMVDLSEKNLTSAAFAKFGKGMSDVQKDGLMRGALLVLAADGQVSSAEQKFLNGLAGGLAVTQSRFDQIMASLQRPATA